MLYNVVSFCCESESCLVVSDSLRPHGLYSPWNSLGQNTGVGSFSLLQGIFPTQGLNPGLPHCRRILYQLSRQRSPSFGCTMKLTSYMHMCITSLPPPQPHPQVITECWAELPEPCSGFPLALCSTRANVYCRSSFPRLSRTGVHMSVLYISVSVAALHMGSSVPVF